MGTSFHFSRHQHQQQYLGESSAGRRQQCAHARISHSGTPKSGKSYCRGVSGHGRAGVVSERLPPTSSMETLEPWMCVSAGMAGGSSPFAVMNSRAISAAACSAAFLARATAVKELCSYPPCGELNAGIVRWHVNLGLAGGGGPSSITKTGVPPCTCGGNTSSHFA